MSGIGKVGKVDKEGTGVKDEESPSDLDTPPRSELAEELLVLKQNSFRAIGKRERVPYPLFWSLFLGKVAGIRDRKSRRALLTEILG